jgi:hypothetical protein
MRVMHACSNYYQGLRPAMIPTFEKYLDPVPTIERQFVYDTFVKIPHLAVHYSADRLYQMYNEMQSTTSHVHIKLSLAEIMAIRAMVMRSTEIRLSTMDTLAAYLITVLNRIEDVPIQGRIFSVVDVRNTQFYQG